MCWRSFNAGASCKVPKLPKKQLRITTFFLYIRLSSHQAHKCCQSKQKTAVTKDKKFCSVLPNQSVSSFVQPPVVFASRAVKSSVHLHFVENNCRAWRRHRSIQQSGPFGVNISSCYKHNRYSKWQRSSSESRANLTNASKSHSRFLLGLWRLWRLRRPEATLWTLGLGESGRWRLAAHIVREVTALLRGLILKSKNKKKEEMIRIFLGLEDFRRWRCDANKRGTEINGTNTTTDTSRPEINRTGCASISVLTGRMTECLCFSVELVWASTEWSLISHLLTVKGRDIQKHMQNVKMGHQVSLRPVLI